MKAETEEQLLRDVSLIKQRILGDKMTGVPSLIDDVEMLKKTKANKVNWLKIFTLGFKIGSKAGGM